MITNNPEALNKKYNYAAGIVCKQNDQGSFDVTLPSSLSHVTQTDIDNAESEYKKPKTYSPSEFFDLFTKAEWKAIKAAAKQSDDVEYWLDKLRVVQFVDTSDRKTIDGINQMVTAKLLTQARADEILG